MRCKEYIVDNRYQIGMFLFLILFMGSMMFLDESVIFLSSNGFYGMVVSTSLFVVYHMIRFLRYGKYYKALELCMNTDNMDFVLVMPEPIGLSEEYSQKALNSLCKDYNEKLSEYQAKSKEDLEFISLWVHESKTPIAAAKLLIESNLDVPSEKALYRIKDEIEQIENYIQMALFYQRSDDFANDYIIGTVSILKVVKDCIRLEYTTITCKKIIFEIDSVDMYVESDAKWLAFIVKQIIDNAIKYSPEGGKLQIYMNQSKKGKVLAIKDEGRGINPQDINRIFNKNFTGTTGRNYYNSTGLGLYLSQKLARKLGHHMSVLSVPEQGTEICIHF